jgi:CheY-like chemotaxis protein/MinD-like ATPase involved in chromosome partitioning or flagellar assembly
MARILLVDDDPGLLQMVRLMLERAGHQVMVAENGETGLAAAFAQMPELALVDVMMPGMNGYDVTRALRSDPRTESLPIIILTARGQPMDRQMALTAGASAYLSKPITSKELIQHVNEALTAPAQVAARPAPELRTAPSMSSSHPASANSPAPEEETAYVSDSLPTLPVVTVIGLRGGVGATTLAVNLAMLMRERGDKVCLADLSATGGQITHQLHVTSRTSWADLLTAGERPEPRVIAAALTTHPHTGTAILAAPASPSSKSLSQETTIHMLNVLTTGFQRIVVDAGTLNSATVGALLVSSAIIVVISDDNASIGATGTMMSSLSGLGVEIGRVRIVVCRVRAEGGPPAPAIVKALGRPIAADMPYDVNQSQALQYGKPLVVATPDAPYSQAAKQLLRTL